MKFETTGMKLKRHSRELAALKEQDMFNGVVLENLLASQAKQDDVIKALRSKVDRLDTASHGE